jgi:hypothetical protein
MKVTQHNVSKNEQVTLSFTSGVGALAWLIHFTFTRLPTNMSAYQTPI